jgi:hypothetical protein
MGFTLKVSAGVGAMSLAVYRAMQSRSYSEDIHGTGNLENESGKLMLPIVFLLSLSGDDNQC